MKHEVVIEGRAEPSQEKTYLHLPFTVPPGAVRLDVSFTYSDRIGSDPSITGGNTVDLGVFDERGIDFLAAGFRGWSGSERLSFTITEHEATPGYLAGPLSPSLWHLLLGLYKVAPQGCAYRATITITTGPEPLNSFQSGSDAQTFEVSETSKVSDGGLQRESGLRGAHLIAPVAVLPSSRPPAPYHPWLRGEMHCHSWHSDGDRSAGAVLELARSRGLDFLAITDHNTIASHRELAGLQDPGLVLIPGVEATTFHGHFNVWGIGDWVDFRVGTRDEMADAIRYASQRGAVTVCNHPKPLGPDWEYRDVGGYECVEVWNGPWGGRNEDALPFWLDLLAAGRRVPAVCGSDWHGARDTSRAPGAPALWVHVPGEASAASILAAIRQGHVAMSAGPAGPLIEIGTADGHAMGGDTVARSFTGLLDLRLGCRGGQGAHLRLLDQNGLLFDQMVLEPDAALGVSLPVPGSLYVRGELRDEDGDMLALTNPIYFT